MRRIAVRFSLIVGIAALASLAIAACADGDPTAPPKSDPASYTQFFVQRAIDRYEEDGRAETVAFYNSMDSVDGPWYLAIYDEDTNTIAHPLRKDFLGTSPRERSDVNGKPYGLEIAAATEEGRWVDYVFVNPTSGETEQKHTWVVKYDGLLFLSGWYEPAN